MLSESVAPVVKSLDDLLREDRWGKETLLPVQHQMKMDVATTYLRRGVEVGDQISLLNRLSIVDQDEPLVKSLGWFGSHWLDRVAEPVGGTRAIVGKRQVESVPVIPTDQWEVGGHPPYGAISDRVNGWVIAGLVVSFRPPIVGVVEVNVGTGVR
jgi:hypothetical protein